MRLQVVADQAGSKHTGDSRNRGKGGQPGWAVTTPDRRGDGDADFWRCAGCGGLGRAARPAFVVRAGLQGKREALAAPYRKRFVKRIDRLEKNWKFSASDIADRTRWDELPADISDILTHTSTEQGRCT